MEKGRNVYAVRLCFHNHPTRVQFSCFMYLNGDLELKGLSHEIFRPVFWPVWMHLGLNVNGLWFFNFKESS